MLIWIISIIFFNKKYNAYNSNNFYNATKYFRGTSILSQKAKDTISKANKGNKYNLGKKHSLKTLEKMSNLKKGKLFSEETKQKISKSKLGNKFALNNKFSEESKNKISLKKKNHPCYKNKERSQKISLSNSKSIVQYDLNNNFIKEWNSIKEASINLKINSSAICLNLKNKTKSSGGFTWKYND